MLYIQSLPVSCEDVHTLLSVNNQLNGKQSSRKVNCFIATHDACMVVPVYRIYMIVVFIEQLLLIHIQLAVHALNYSIQSIQDGGYNYIFVPLPLAPYNKQPGAW